MLEVSTDGAQQKKENILKRNELTQNVFKNLHLCQIKYSALKFLYRFLVGFYSYFL